MLSLHPSRASTLRQPERLEVQPDVAVSEFIDTFGNRCSRLFAPAGRVVLRNEAFVGGQWYAFDPRHNVPRIGRVLMARGRDAADTALTTTFGVNQLASFTVWTDVVSEETLRQPQESPQDSVISW
jgi:hypothetical protein